MFNMLVAINAQGKNRVIGNGLYIPWHIKDEFLHFKRTTLNHTLVMGSTTFTSIGKPLPNRKTIVVCYDKDFDAQGCEVVTDLNEIIKRYKDSEEVVFVCGGASIYKQLLPYCQELIISIVKGDYEGDVFFPEYEDQFEAYKEEEHEEFTVIWYKKK